MSVRSILGVMHGRRESNVVSGRVREKLEQPLKVAIELMPARLRPY